MQMLLLHNLKLFNHYSTSSSEIYTYIYTYFENDSKEDLFE